MLAEFKVFLLGYNVVGIAIGLIIAAQVNTLVADIIDDLVTPLILSPIFKKLHVENLDNLSRNGVLYGKVIAGVIKFIVVAFLVFLVVKNLGVQKV